MGWLKGAWRKVEKSAVGQIVSRGLGTIAAGVTAPAAALAGMSWANELIKLNSLFLRKLSPELIEKLQPHFHAKNAVIGPIDLDDVVIGEKCVGVPDGMAAITFGNVILCAGELDFSRIEHLRLLVHELEHCQQYHIRGGLYPFLVSYCAQAGIAITERGRFDVHGDIELEREAASKERVADEVFRDR